MTRKLRKNETNLQEVITLLKEKVLEKEMNDIHGKEVDDGENGKERFILYRRSSMGTSSLDRVSLLTGKSKERRVSGKHNKKR